MKLYRIFIPKRYNDGTTIPIEKTTKILNEFVEDTMDIKKWFSANKELWRQYLEQEEFLIIVQDLR